jgi:hypothetical protein
MDAELPDSSTFGGPEGTNFLEIGGGKEKKKKKRNQKEMRFQTSEMKDGENGLDVQRFISKCSDNSL